MSQSIPTPVLARTALMLAAQQLLLNAPTNAGARVYTARDWPTATPLLPNIRLAMPRESKASLGRNQPQFTTTATLAFHVRCQGATSALAEAALEVLCGQIEAVILTNQEALRLQQFSTVDTDARTSSEGETPIAEAMIQVGCEFYERFNPAPGIPLEQINTYAAVDPATVTLGTQLELAPGENLDLGGGTALDLTIGQSANTLAAIITLGTTEPESP